MKQTAGQIKHWLWLERKKALIRYDKDKNPTNNNSKQSIITKYGPQDPTRHTGKENHQA